jgi:quinol monooxygenase YgiN
MISMGFFAWLCNNSAAPKCKEARTREIRNEPIEFSEGPVVQLVWEFVAREDKLAEFERHYASDGTWAQLFRRSAGFRGTTLLRDTGQRGRYLTVDSWESADAHRAMRVNFSREYDELNRVCEEFTERESHLGDFEVE